MTKEIKPIKTKQDYREALEAIESLFDSKPGTEAGNLLEVLSILVEKYENDHFTIDPPDPVEAIKFRMEQMGLERGDVVAAIGSRSRVSEVLSGKRGLTVKMIRNLHKRFGIPAESLIGSR